MINTRKDTITKNEIKDSNDKGYINAFNEYVNEGILSSKLACEVIVAKTNQKYGEPQDLSDKQRKVYAWFDADVKRIKEMLKNIEGSDKANCPYERVTNGKGDYTFERTEYLGRHLISIHRTRDNFHWTVGVAYQGNFSKLDNDVNIVGYYHVDTNGNLKDLQESLAATKHLFPKPQPPRYEMCTTRELKEKLFLSLRWPENTSITQPSTESKEFFNFKVDVFDQTGKTPEQIEQLKLAMSESFIKQIKKLYPAVTIIQSDITDKQGEIHTNVIQLKMSDVTSVINAADKIKAASKAAIRFNRMWQGRTSDVADMPCDITDQEMAKSVYAHTSPSTSPTAEKIKAPRKIAGNVSQLWQGKNSAATGMPCDVTDEEMAKSVFAKATPRF